MPTRAWFDAALAQVLADLPAGKDLPVGRDLAGLEFCATAGRRARDGARTGGGVDGSSWTR